MHIFKKIKTFIPVKILLIYIDVPLSVLPSGGCIDTHSKIDYMNSVSVFYREVGIIMRANKIIIRA
jgi:hypothetical protein